MVFRYSETYVNQISINQLFNLNVYRVKKRLLSYREKKPVVFEKLTINCEIYVSFTCGALVTEGAAKMHFLDIKYQNCCKKTKTIGNVNVM